jgi:hypothetical protein
VQSDGSYLSASDDRVHFGLGPSITQPTVVVIWPDGVRERYSNVGLDRQITVVRGKGDHQ